MLCLTEDDPGALSVGVSIVGGFQLKVVGRKRPRLLYPFYPAK